MVAEGIEIQGQLERLRCMGVRYGQGRLLAPPMPADQLAPWLEYWRGGEAEPVQTGPGKLLH